MFAQFLRSLLEKFKNSQTKRNGENSYPDKVARALDKTIRDNSTHISEECPICLETPLIEKACVTNCAHMFCTACLVGVLKEKLPGGVKQLVCCDGLCPVCQGEVNAKSIILFSKQREGGFTTSFMLDKKPPKCDARQPNSESTKSMCNDTARQVLLKAVNGAQSSKLTAVVQELHSIWELDPGSKVLVFSQFLGFLDMMEISLSEIGIPFGRLDGKMTLKQRVAALDVFKTNTESKVGSVMLVSMGLGCGLNLVAASTVFIVDPWWNQVSAGRACYRMYLGRRSPSLTLYPLRSSVSQAIEDQCINRIHRIGQKAEMLRVRKFVVEDSVEERIVELQRKKKGMANEVYSDIKADGTSSSARLSVDDFKLIFSNLGS
jgi:DNA repair protein RAD5